MKPSGERKPYTIPLPAKLITFVKGKSAKTILDLGCGYGRACFFLHEEDLEVTGVDLDRLQVELALQEKKSRGILEGISLIVNDARNLCFPDCSFDVVTMLGVLTLVSKAERPRIMDEVCRVLKPSGYVVIEEFGRTWKIQSIGRDTKTTLRSRANWGQSQSETMLARFFISVITSRVKSYTVC
jgi:ubiquinone/menaquinone biosynthesis C-methylase UbiE